MKQNTISLAFCIWECDDIHPDDITELTGIMPTKIHVIGLPKWPKMSTSAVWQHNAWILKSSLGEYAEFKEQMDQLIALIRSKIEIFKNSARNILPSFLVQ